jgi:hypothetical protein
MSAGRAKTGGQIGQNGEFYKGGTFLPSTDNPKRTPTKRKRGPKRDLVAPGEFAEYPEGHGSIFMVIRNYVAFDRLADGTFGPFRRSDNAKAIAYQFGDGAMLDELIAKYNAGERFFPYPARSE